MNSVGSARAVFTVTLTQAVSEPVHVDWRTVEGTALAGRDFAQNSGTVTFAPGETKSDIEVFVYGRTVDTEDRTFYVELTPPLNAVLADELGECIIRVDTTGSQPAVKIIVARGEQGRPGDSAYLLWLQQGNQGSVADFLASLRPAPEEIAPLVAPLINVGQTKVTASGTDDMSQPDTLSLSDLAARIPFAPGALKAVGPALQAGDNVVPVGAFTGDSIDPTNYTGLCIYTQRQGSLVTLAWEFLAKSGEIAIFGAASGDIPIAVQVNFGGGDASHATIVSGPKRLSLKRWIAALRENTSRGLLKFNTPALQKVSFTPAISRSPNDYTVIASGNDLDRYHHSPRIAVDAEGGIHTVYSRALMHGYGGRMEANAVDPEGEIIYSYSGDNGATLSAEQVICRALPPEPENKFRTVFDCHVGVCPSGRIVIIVSDIPPPSANPPGGWGRNTGSTKYRLFISDENGRPGSWVDKGVFFTTLDDYARIYCQRIKMIPKAGGGFRMAFCDYRKYSKDPSSLYMIGMWYSDDEFETNPVQGAPIMMADGGNNETDFAFVDSNLGYAISRNDWAMRVTRDGGKSWTKIGTQANFPANINADLIAPILDCVYVRGNPYILMGYSERGSNPRSIRWVHASVQDLTTFEQKAAAGEKYRPWGPIFQTGPALLGSSGYHSALHFKDGALLYVDCSETSVSPNTGFMRCDIRMVRANTEPWFPYKAGLVVGPASSSRMTVYERNEKPLIPEVRGSGVVGAPTYVSQGGHGIRIGDQYSFHGQVNISALGGMTASPRIFGLPYTYGSIGFHHPVNIVMKSPLVAAVGNSSDIVGYVIDNTKYIQLYKRNRVSGALTALSVDDLDGTSFVCDFHGTYQCRYEADLEPA